MILVKEVKQSSVKLQTGLLKHSVKMASVYFAGIVWPNIPTTYRALTFWPSEKKVINVCICHFLLSLNVTSPNCCRSLRDEKWNSMMQSEVYFENYDLDIGIYGNKGTLLTRYIFQLSLISHHTACISTSDRMKINQIPPWVNWPPLLRLTIRGTLCLRETPPLSPRDSEIERSDWLSWPKRLKQTELPSISQ